MGGRAVLQADKIVRPRRAKPGHMENAPIDLDLEEWNRRRKAAKAGLAAVARKDPPRRTQAREIEELN
jgi:L-ascorbate metabolism protein UlaG (beta-lactamase superfamily)